MKNEVAIIMGSDSDLEVMNDAAKTLEEFGIGCDLTIVSAHRTPDRLYNFAKDAKVNGTKIIIAGAGGSAHLPGMVASLTSIPVIGVPIKTKSMDGLDSLLSIAQMPPGIPVATVAVNGAVNAALLALQILGVSQKEISQKIEDYKKNLNTSILEKAKKLETVGFKKYLKEKND